VHDIALPSLPCISVHTSPFDVVTQMCDWTINNRQSPSWIYAHLNLGNLHRGRGRFQHAIRSYLAVVHIAVNDGGHPLSEAQREVCRVLNDYEDILAMKPNHHWHKLTPVSPSPYITSARVHSMCDG
jgi:hypothetical protein